MSETTLVPHIRYSYRRWWPLKRRTHEGPCWDMAKPISFRESWGGLQNRELLKWTEIPYPMEIFAISIWQNSGPKLWEYHTLPVVKLLPRDSYEFRPGSIRITPKL